MPYSFTKIEEDKSKTIQLVFFMLIGVYFIAFWLIALVIKNYFVFQESSLYSSSSFLILNISESLVILVLALLVGAGHWLYTTSNIVPATLNVLMAGPPDPIDNYHKMFLNIVEEVSVATGGRKIEAVVIPSSAMNAFALADFEGRAVIGVTEGLLSRLTRPQIEAVVGHKAAHIVAGDCLPTTVCVSLFHLYSGLLVGMQELLRTARSSSRRQGSSAGALILIIYFILAITKFFSYLITMFISREREYRADAVSVRLTRDPLALAEALYAISYRWRGAGLPAQQLEAIFILNPAYSGLDERGGFLSDLFSTHPPVEHRLKILLDMAHSDVKAIEEDIKRQADKPRIIPPEINQMQPRYMLNKEGQWLGPFEISQIVTLDWLKPTTWIQPLNDEGIKMACEDEGIKALLKKSDVKGCLACPRCKVPLQKEIYEGAQIDRCSFCQGILIQEKDIGKIIFREEIGFSQRILRIAEGIKKDQMFWREEKIKKDPNTLYGCPQCQRETIKMVRMFYSAGYHVEIDKCIFCGIVWFNRDELEVLQCLIEQMAHKDPSENQLEDNPRSL